MKKNKRNNLSMLRKMNLDKFDKKLKSKNDVDSVSFLENFLKNENRTLLTSSERREEKHNQDIMLEGFKGISNRKLIEIKAETIKDGINYVYYEGLKRETMKKMLLAYVVGNNSN